MADIYDFVNIVKKHIDSLNGINTKVDFTEDYERGYNDACVAIKNTLKTDADKWIKENNNEK